MTFQKRWWLALGALFVVPYLLLFLAGTIWLYERGWLWGWLAVSTITTLVGWWLMRRLRRPVSTPGAPAVEPEGSWSPAGRAAWRDVEAIARRAQAADLPLDRLDPLWQVIREVLEVVARHYHPRSKRPEMEIPLPYVLRVIELVASDLRHACSEYMPGSHILTLHDFERLSQMAVLGKRLYFLYRLASFGLDPAGALLRETRDLFGGKVLDASTAELKSWAVSYCVRRAGHYAIQLYSGQLLLSDVDFDAFQSPSSQQDFDKAARRDDAVADEPLRVLVVGQVKAGKSSLINALFGETRAAVDVVPRTRHVEPFVLERDGLRRAIILDTAGYADAQDRENPFAAARREVLRCDVVLMVCSATSAARDADRRLLKELRAFFQSEPDRLPPPLIGVVTHIDQVRPWNEWQPPYDLLQPQTAKARHIAAAVQSVAADLAIPAERVVPVCLHPDREYNVNEALIPAILEQLTDAERVKYLRCLREFHDAQYWRRLLQQAVNSGRLLWSALAPRRS